MASRTPAPGACYKVNVLTLLALLFAVFKHGVADDVDINIDVVETSPERAAILAMATAARLVAVEPGEPLGVGAALCGAGGAAVCVGASGLAAGGAGAAARAGRTLLLVDPAPALPPARLWSVLAMYPHEDVLAEAGKAICAAKGWQRAVLLHEGPASCAARLAPDDDLLVLSARALPPPDDEALLRNLLLVLKKTGASNFVVWCDAACCVRVLGAAQRVGMLAERHSYLLLTLDLHTQALDPFSHGGANLTTLRIFNTTSDDFTNFTRDLSTAFESSEPPEEMTRALAAPSTALVLAWDAARWVRSALRLLALPTPATPDATDCSAGFAEHHADTLLNYLRSEQWAGASGMGLWEADGARRAVRLLLAELHRGGDLEVVGSWSHEEGIVWTRIDPPAPPEQPDSMTNRTFTVLIAKNPPYVMMRESAERLSGNERYEGFCIELIEKLAEQLNFNYTFMEQRDGKYGSYNNVTRQWNGMMLELMTKPDIHFAITDLTITAEREQVVDFTTPFMNLGISILFKMPKAPEPETFAFMLPFSSGVWLCLGLAYVGTSLLLYVVGRLSPEEWQNPYPCVDDPPALDNQFTLANALWFNLGAVLLQGSEIAPVAYSTRAVASVWWLFALVITSSYTANLATLLAKKAPVDIIKNVEELARSGEIEYGAKDGGSTYTFFEHSQNQLYKEMFEVMKTKEMPKSNPEGIQRVMKGNYAFLMESTTIEHETQRNCDVVQVGDLLDNKGYGIAMKKGSGYRQALNLALLNLQERGVLREMKNKWWNELHGGGRCKAAEERESERLNMNNFTGLFLVLVVGCAVGLAGALVELAWVARSRPGPAGRSYWRRLGDELRFVFQFDRSVKPLRPEPSSSPTTLGFPSPAPPAEESTPPAPATRSGSLRSGHWSARRRRSSMAAASARRARHTTTADSSPSAAAAAVSTPQRQ